MEKNQEKTGNSLDQVKTDDLVYSLEVKATTLNEDLALKRRITPENDPLKALNFGQIIDILNYRISGMSLEELENAHNSIAAGTYNILRDMNQNNENYHLVQDLLIGIETAQQIKNKRSETHKAVEQISDISPKE